MGILSGRFEKVCLGLLIWIIPLQKIIYISYTCTTYLTLNPQVRPDLGFFVSLIFQFYPRVMGWGAAEATGLGFVCFVIINQCVLSANRVDFRFFCFINFPILLLRYGFLFARYKKDTLYWEAVILLRKLGVVICLVFVATKPRWGGGGHIFIFLRGVASGRSHILFYI